MWICSKYEDDADDDKINKKIWNSEKKAQENIFFSRRKNRNEKHTENSDTASHYIASKIYGKVKCKFNFFLFFSLENSHERRRKFLACLFSCVHKLNLIFILLRKVK